MSTTEKYLMTPEHKEHLAVGRQHSRIVRQYIEALKSRGNRKSPEVIRARIQDINGQLLEAPGSIEALKLLSERDHLNADLEADEGNLEELQARFVEVAAQYGRHKGITFTAWRAVGVPAGVLREAGISRSNS